MIKDIKIFFILVLILLYNQWNNYRIQSEMEEHVTWKSSKLDILSEKLEYVRTFLLYMDTKDSLNDSELSFRNLLIKQEANLEVILDAYPLEK